MGRTLVVLRQCFWWSSIEQDKPSTDNHYLFPSDPGTLSQIYYHQMVTVILTVVDHFSKAAHFIPLSQLPTAKETAELMIQHVFRLLGFPRGLN